MQNRKNKVTPEPSLSITLLNIILPIHFLLDKRRQFFCIGLVLCYTWVATKTRKLKENGIQFCIFIFFSHPLNCSGNITWPFWISSGIHTTKRTNNGYIRIFSANAAYKIDIGLHALRI